MTERPKQYCYDYPHPAVTVDILCLREGPVGIEILLIQRKNEPFKGTWALPGGFVNIDEDLEPAARRELTEEAGLTADRMTQLGAFGKPERDPRGRTISIAFYTWFRDKGATDRIQAADDAAYAKWFEIHHLPDLAFDHEEIIAQGLAAVEER